MTFAEASRLLRTVRHLRPSQIVWRVRYRYRRQRRWSCSAPGESYSVRRDLPDVPLFDHGERVDLDALLRRDEFCHRHHCRPFPADWCLGRQDTARLWVLALHEHGWALDLARAAVGGGPDSAAALEFLVRKLSDWIDRCDIDQLGTRELAWNGYAIATRLGSWARVYHLLHGQGSEQWRALEPRFLHSFWRQAEFLSQHIEWDLRGNHLIRDAVGLAWAGRFFDVDQPRRWLEAATSLAVGQANEQVLSDGGHFERTPMYHLHVMEDLLTLALLLEDADAAAILRGTWSRMADAVRRMCHPDGRIALLNDSAFNGASRPGRLLDLGDQRLRLSIDSSPPRGGSVLQAFGLVAWHGDPWTIFFDIGPVGVSYQPGHAHADSLTIEASYRGERLFVDPGTYAYDLDERRRYDRSTEAHNTVCINGTDSSEVWHIFRVGRRARPLDVEVATSQNDLSASASHSGYDHLPGRPRHRRTVGVVADGLFRISDQITGYGRARVSGGLLLAPGWKAELHGRGWRVTHGGLCVEIRVSAIGLSLATEQRRYHPEYGTEELSHRLCWTGEVDLPCAIDVLVSPQS
jgi:hypothetical protein